MKVTKISVTLGKKLPHPTKQYSSVDASVSMEASVDLEDPDKTATAMELLRSDAATHLDAAMRTQMEIAQND